MLLTRQASIWTAPQAVRGIPARSRCGWTRNRVAGSSRWTRTRTRCRPRGRGWPGCLPPWINFRYAGQALEQLGIDKINGALLDLGVSSHQLDDAARGFSYRADAPLDMRMSQEGETAADLVNTESREELARILKDYGEEPFAWQIAGKIVEAREASPIETTLQLADIVASAMPAAERRKNKNPSRRTFQALRIAVNHELDALEEGMDTIFEHLAPGGRLCIITFHSLEDRLVKNKFRRWATACTCPPEFPVCVCGGKAKAKLITRKPIEANTQELEENRRSRSAHLRVLEKI